MRWLGWNKEENSLIICFFRFVSSSSETCWVIFGVGQSGVVTWSFDCVDLVCRGGGGFRLSLDFIQCIQWIQALSRLHQLRECLCLTNFIERKPESTLTLTVSFGVGVVCCRGGEKNKNWKREK